jgi:hypothetical protein
MEVSEKDAMPGEKSIFAPSMGSRIPLRRFELLMRKRPSESSAMDGNNTAETDKLLGKVKRVCGMHSGQENDSYRRLVRRFTVMKTLEYLWWQ